MSDDGDMERKTHRPPSDGFFVAALIVGAYVMLPGIFLGGIHVKAGDEMVDHVVPGLVVLALVVACIRWRWGAPHRMPLPGIGILLVGVWMTDVHVALLRQALRGQAPAGATAYHCSTAVVVDVLGLAWVWRYRHAASPHR